MRYSNFTAYVAMEEGEDLQVLLFNLMSFYRMFERCPFNEEAEALYNAGEWMISGTCSNSLGVFEMFDNAQHAAHRAVDEFKHFHTNPSDFDMSFEQYLLFNKICNRMEHVSVRNAIADFECQLNKKDLEENAEVER